MQALWEEFGVALLFVNANLDDEMRALERRPVGFAGKPFEELGILQAIARLQVR